VAANNASSFFVAEGGRLMSCGSEMVYGQPGVLGNGELDFEEGRVVPIPTLLLSMAGIRISSVSAGYGFIAAVSAAGTVYTWGEGADGRLGHGDTERSLVPKQVQALAGHRVLSVAAGYSHCLAVTEKGEVFSWGYDRDGQCGHESSSQQHLLPRRVEALTGVRVSSVSAGDVHSLVVTEMGALFSFALGGSGMLGHGSAGN
jgi:alpha-tubulin suppressor-like RCC1 family protein